MAKAGDQSMWSAAKRRILIGILTAASWVLAFAVYQWADRHGRVSHFAVTRVVMATNWMDGETKECVTGNPGMDQKMLDCELDGGVSAKAGKTHLFRVEFLGRMNQRGLVLWHCSRTADGMVCRTPQ
jgi:hypothetical protein